MRINKKVLITIPFFFLTFLISSCDQQNTDLDKDILPRYKNSTLGIDERVEDLLGRMTIEEKVGQMVQFVGINHLKRSEKFLSIEELKKSDASGFYPNLHSSQIPDAIKSGLVGSFLHVLDVEEANTLQKHAQESRLGIPLIIGIDAIHGNAMVRGTTVYPAPLAMASSWNIDLVEKASIQTAIEMRATGSHWTFAPNIDLARDPRWGRVGETFGEDTHLVGEMGVAMIQGLQQGDFTSKNTVVANAKHWAAGGEPLTGINLSPMDVSMRTLYEDFFPPFERAIEAGVFTFMAAHNEINGEPAHGSKFLLTEVLREDWKFDGFVVSDWMDVSRLHTFHKVAENPKEAVYQTVDAGMDMNMHGPNFAPYVLELVKEGRLSERRIDDSVRPILTAKFRLGLFEKSIVDKEVSKDSIHTAEHQQTSLDIARESIVLLKNKGDVLPLKPGIKIMLTGPNADNHSILGDWVMRQPDENITTIREGLEAVEGIELDFVDVGSQVNDITTEKINRVVESISDQDVIVIAVGENPLRYDRKGKTTGENVARSSLGLFGRQLEMIQAAKMMGKPIVVILVNGRPIAEPWLVENIDVIIEAWEPGAKGGEALADIIMGQINPSGKLPITIPYSVGHLQAIYDHKPSAYRHKFVDTPTKNLFEFGFGLSYSTYEYEAPKLSKKQIKSDESTSISVKLTNTGKYGGAEIVQLYIRDDFSQITRPVKELKGFKRIYLESGESATIEFLVEPDMLAYYNRDMEWTVEQGSYTLMIGPSSRQSDLKSAKLIVN